MARLQSRSRAPETRKSLSIFGSCHVECGAERGETPIWGLWGEGDLVVGLGKEGTGAVVDHCSGMRQAFCMVGEGD